MYCKRAITLLKSMFGKDAEFRDGQLDAIIAAVDGKRVLVVQQTGWGKSVVYFDLPPKTVQVKC